MPLVLTLLATWLYSTVIHAGDLPAYTAQGVPLHLYQVDPFAAADWIGSVRNVLALLGEAAVAVYVGAWVAPGRRLETAAVLAILAVIGPLAPGHLSLAWRSLSALGAAGAVYAVRVVLLAR